jgi:hypothetical protein
VEHVAKVGQLTILARYVSKALVDLGMPPIPGIPWDPCTASDILEVVGVISEHLREANASDHGP